MALAVLTDKMIAVLNVGSSSVKADLFTIDKEEPQLRASAKKEEVTDFASAITTLLDRELPRESIAAVGHRVVHGGAHLPSPIRIDDAVVQALEATVRLAPLHNPPAIRGIAIARKLFRADVPHFAVFDTAFHQTLPSHARRYAVSERLERELGVRRFGFHGSSHAYVARRAAKFLSQPSSDLRIITLHLGNGASVTAIRNGESIDTSMGMTPLEGLVMGTRSGDLDPAIPIMLMRQGWSADEIEQELNQRSGLRGLANASDMRELLKREDSAAEEALRLYVYRIKKYIGAYYAILGGVDAVVFTGGVGEHATEIRAGVVHGLEHLGITIDEAKNRVSESGERRIDKGGVAVLVIPTDEEQEIARQIARQISS